MNKAKERKETGCLDSIFVLSNVMRCDVMRHNERQRDHLDGQFVLLSNA